MHIMVIDHNLSVPARNRTFQLAWSAAASRMMRLGCSQSTYILASTSRISANALMAYPRDPDADDKGNSVGVVVARPSD